MLLGNAARNSVGVICGKLNVFKVTTSDYGVYVNIINIL